MHSLRMESLSVDQCMILRSVPVFKQRRLFRVFPLEIVRLRPRRREKLNCRDNDTSARLSRFIPWQRANGQVD